MIGVRYCFQPGLLASLPLAQLHEAAPRGLGEAVQPLALDVGDLARGLQPRRLALEVVETFRRVCERRSLLLDRCLVEAAQEALALLVARERTRAFVAKLR